MANEAAPLVRVCVCYARPHQAWLRELALPAGATVSDAIGASGFAQAFPGLDPWQAGVGLFGRAVPATHVLHDGDRVEIYRPLAFDPMESRRRRATHRARALPAGRPARTPKARR
jgi:putative ubiquitin-RnfH superfamily antitoxin RatB of RatAB toxin-antitoxin module